MPIRKNYEIPVTYHTSGIYWDSPPVVRGVCIQDPPFPREEALDLVLGPCVWCGNDYVDDGTGACNSCYGSRDGNLWLP